MYFKKTPFKLDYATIASSERNFLIRKIFQTKIILALNRLNNVFSRHDMKSVGKFVTRSEFSLISARVKVLGTRADVHYINTLTLLRGFRVNFKSFFCLSFPKRDLGAKKTAPNIELCPESLGNMLEY